MKIIAIIISIMSILGFGSNDTSKVLDMGIYPKTAMVFEPDDKSGSYCNAAPWFHGTVTSPCKRRVKYPKFS